MSHAVAFEIYVQDWPMHLCTFGLSMCWQFPPGQIWFVDMEYAGINYRGFDIAQYFSEFAGAFVRCVVCVV